MNILYINHYAGSPKHGMEFRPYYLAREWVKLGHKVTILASAYSHLRQHNPDISKSTGNYSYETIDGIDYIWCKTLEYPQNGVKRLLNIFDFLLKGFKLSGVIKTKIKPDLVIASSTYPFDTLLAHKIAKQNNAKFYYEVHDLWPLTPMEIGGMSKYHPLIMAMQYAENYGYRNSDFTVSMLPNAFDYMQQHGLNKSRYKYIPNGVVISDWQNKVEPLTDVIYQQIAEIKAQYQFVLGYAGSLGESNAMEYLVDAAKYLDQNIAVVIVGDGVSKEKLLEQSQKLGLTNIYFLRAIAKYQIPSLLALFDACYIGWHNYPIYRFGISPNKIFDYMLAARPIIHSINLAGNFVDIAKCGITVEAENPQAIASAINQIAKLSSKELLQLGVNGNQYVLQNHDYEILARKFID